MAMRNGAFDYLQKPFKREDLLLVVNRALSHTSLEREVARLKGRLESLGETEAAQSRSPAMLDQMDKCRRAAPTDATVMILGESGTGKEVTARLIHDLSRRKDGAICARGVQRHARFTDRERIVRLRARRVHGR